MCSKQMIVIMKLVFKQSTLTRILCHWTNLKEEIMVEKLAIPCMC
jgi:hypothetical protein